MTTKFLLPLLMVSALALSACGNNDTDNTPAAATAAPAAAASTATPAAPTTTPAANSTTAPAAMTPEEAMQAIQAQAATMTDAQKQEAVAGARKAAEDMGKTQGLSDEQIKQAADLAETTTRQMLGMQ